MRTFAPGVDSASSARRNNVSPNFGAAPNGKNSLLTSIGFVLVNAVVGARLVRLTVTVADTDFTAGRSATFTSRSRVLDRWLIGVLRRHRSHRLSTRFTVADGTGRIAPKLTL